MTIAPIKVNHFAFDAAHFILSVRSVGAVQLLGTVAGANDHSLGANMRIYYVKYTRIYYSYDVERFQSSLLTSRSARSFWSGFIFTRGCTHNLIVKFVKQRVGRYSFDIPDTEKSIYSYSVRLTN